MATIDGKRLERHVGEFSIRRLSDEVDEYGTPKFDIFTFRCRALPASWDVTASNELPRPSAAKVNNRDIRDPNGSGQMVPDTSTDTPEYRAAEERWSLRKKAMRIYDSTIDGIEWETDPALRKADPERFFDAILEELGEFASGQEVSGWVARILMLSTLAGSDVLRAQEDFLSIEEGLRAIQARRRELEEIGPGSEPEILDPRSVSGVGEVAG